MKIKIEKGVQIPKKGKYGYKEFPFDKMQIGDSFFVPLEEGKALTSLNAQISTNARTYSDINGKNWKFKTCRIREGIEGIRIWRIK